MYAFITRAVFLDNTNRVESFFVEISDNDRYVAARRTARSLAALHNDNPDNASDQWFAGATPEGATVYGPGSTAVVLVTAKEDN